MSVQERSPRARPGPLSDEERAALEERVRLVVEVRPGERELLPGFGCRIHELRSVRTPLERHIGAALIEEALERWTPWLGVRRVDVLGSRAAAGGDSDGRSETLRIRVLAARTTLELDVAWFGDEEAA